MVAEKETETAITGIERKRMLHAIGMDYKPFPRWIYRNRYITALACEDDLIWRSLVDRGLASTWRNVNQPGSCYYQVSRAGLEVLGRDVLIRVPKSIRPTK